MFKETGVTLKEALESVGSGWSSLVKKVYLEMANYPGTKIVQVKEKFGRLRIYWDSPKSTKEEGKKLLPFCDMVLKVDKDSGTVCEVCGKPGTIDHSKDWLLTLCSDHRRGDSTVKDSLSE